METGTSTIADATVIGTPSSTKNAESERDAEIAQTRKNKRRFFGMNCTADGTVGWAWYAA